MSYITLKKYQILAGPRLALLLGDGPGAFGDHDLTAAQDALTKNGDGIWYPLMVI